MGRLAIVVPLREDAHDEALALLRKGPPLDPEGGGIERYWGLLSEAEAVLVFEGPGVRGGESWRDLSAWRDGARWQRCARHPPRLADGVHAWLRAGDLDGIFFGPLPGPGDSDGGDTVERPRHR